MAKSNAADIRAQAAELDLDEAYALREQQEDLNKRKNAVKVSLANAVALGYLSDEQVKEVRALFPERDKTPPSERVAKLEAQLAKAREKAAADQNTETAVANAA